jgi:single-strand DNA-binding protein
MALQLNRLQLAGNLTRDPEIRFLANEKVVASFGLAINRKWKDANGQAKEETVFVDVTAWGRTAELVGQYLAKGAGAFVEGRLSLDSWEDKTTGQKRSKLVVVADSVQFTTSKSDAPRADSAEDVAPAPRRPATVAGAGAGYDDAVPF